MVKQIGKKITPIQPKKFDIVYTYFTDADKNVFVFSVEKGEVFMLYYKSWYSR